MKKFLLRLCGFVGLVLAVVGFGALLVWLDPSASLENLRNFFEGLVNLW